MMIVKMIQDLGERIRDREREETIEGLEKARRPREQVNKDV